MQKIQEKNRKASIHQSLLFYFSILEVSTVTLLSFSPESFHSILKAQK